ncbi:MAG: hypothetical protein IPM06_04520 [Rhizobiales bacterium]|nr:hypothetical protein [Hyphomicrobiales bacterium]
MISDSFVSADHFHLELVRTLTDDQSQGINLRLVNEEGVAIMTFALPVDIVRALTVSEDECLLAMSLRGSITVYGGDYQPRRLLEIDLDELIEQNLAPEMLEDEPNLKAQLQELRRKLMESLALVERTLAGLAKPET